MATIQTKFNVGEKAITIDPKTMKVREFTIGSMGATVNKNGSTVTLYPLKDDGDVDYYTSYDEDKCFVTDKELMDYVQN